MTTSDAVRRVGLDLPRTYERQVRGRWKLKVKQDRLRRLQPRRAVDGLRLPQGRARRADRLRSRDLLPAADLGPALPVGVRPPAPARPGREARAGRGCVAEVHAEE